MVHPVDEAESPLGAFIDDTIAQQQFKAGYGNSHLSFWGQYPKLAAWGWRSFLAVWNLDDCWP
jgi:hypothetical protein